MRWFTCSILVLSGLMAGCGRQTPTRPAARVAPATGAVDATGAGSVKTFTLPGSYSFPGSITTGPDGALWFTESGKIGRITTAGALKEFALPNGHSGTSITNGPDGALWFTEPSASAIGRITTAGVVTEIVVPGACRVGYSCPIQPKPQGIVAGSDGALWFTETMFSRSSVRTVASKIVRLTTAGAFTEYALPGGSTKITTPNVGAIAAGPDGALWFTDSFERRIWRATTAGALRFYSLPSGQPAAIVAGPDGALWFTATNANPAQLDRISTAGVITTKSVSAGPNGASLGAIASGPDGNLWFALYDMTLSAGAITRSTTAGAMTKYPFATYNEVDGITRGPDGAVWFTQTDNQSGVSRIGRMATQ
jgi:virginiamycin B lyase